MQTWFCSQTNSTNRMQLKWNLNVSVGLHVYNPFILVSSANCTIYTHGIGIHCFTVSSLFFPSDVLIVRINKRHSQKQSITNWTTINGYRIHVYQHFHFINKLIFSVSKCLRPFICLHMTCCMTCMQYLLDLYNWPAQHYKTPLNQLQHVVIKIDVLSNNVTCTTFVTTLWIPALLIHFHVVFTMALSKTNALNGLYSNGFGCTETHPINLFWSVSIFNNLLDVDWHFIGDVMILPVTVFVFHRMFILMSISATYSSLLKNHLRNPDRIV